MENKIEISTNEISNRIYTLRGSQVMLDSDLAEIYQVETKVLKQAVKRNIKRFPSDFMFELSRSEFENLRSQIVTSNMENSFKVDAMPILSLQSVTSSLEDPSRPRGGSRYMPFAFTESGVAMLSSVLHSQRAIQINIEIMMAFVRFRKQPKANFESLENKLDLVLQRLDNLESQLRHKKTTAFGLTKHEPVSMIQSIVARHWGVRVEDLKSPIRTREFSLPRQVAIYLVRKHLHLSLNNIGQHFGQRDHTSILYAYYKIEAALGLDPMIQEAINALQGEIWRQGRTLLVQ